MDGREQRKVFVFRDYRIDKASGELRRGEDLVPLSPTNFQLLLCLVSRAGEFVSKEVLLDHVWPDAAVGEGSLSRAVSTVRKALGDDARHPVFIATIPWRGYRFIAQVHHEGRVNAGAILLHTSGRFSLRAGETIVGRAADCDIVIVAGTISRHHARLVVSESATTLEDLGSRNGTFLLGTRIDGQELVHDGNDIRLGAEHFTYREETSNETEPLQDD